MRPLNGVVITAVLSAALATPAIGNIVLLEDTRLVRAAASASSPSGTDSEGPITDTPAAFGAEFNGSALAGAVVLGAAVGASTGQLSTIEPQQIRVQGSVSLSGSVQQGGSGMSEGLSLVDLLFRVPGGTQLEIISSRTGVGEVELRNARGDLLFEGSGFFRATVAGEFRLIARAEAMLHVPPSGGDGGGYSVILNAVPAPGCGTALLGMVVLTGARRRRAL